MPQIDLTKLAYSIGELTKSGPVGRSTIYTPWWGRHAGDDGYVIW
jgi:hypothetical protein